MKFHWCKCNKFNVVFVIIKDGEPRSYDLNDIESMKHEDDYVYLNKSDGNFYQVKFEDGNFLVIDEYDDYGNHINDVGCHVFGE